MPPLEFVDGVIVNGPSETPPGPYKYHLGTGKLEYLSEDEIPDEPAHFTLDQRLGGDAGLPRLPDGSRGSHRSSRESGIPAGIVRGRGDSRALLYARETEIATEDTTCNLLTRDISREPV